MNKRMILNQVGNGLIKALKVSFKILGFGAKVGISFMFTLIMSLWTILR